MSMVRLRAFFSVISGTVASKVGEGSRVTGPALCDPTLTREKKSTLRGYGRQS